MSVPRLMSLAPFSLALSHPSNPNSPAFNPYVKPLQRKMDLTANPVLKAFLAGSFSGTCSTVLFQVRYINLASYCCCCYVRTLRNAFCFVAFGPGQDSSAAEDLLARVELRLLLLFPWQDLHVLCGPPRGPDGERHRAVARNRPLHCPNRPRGRALFQLPPLAQEHRLRRRRRQGTAAAEATPAGGGLPGHGGEVRGRRNYDPGHRRQDQVQGKRGNDGPI